MSEYQLRRQQHVDRAEAYHNEADRLLVSSGWLVPLRALLFFAMLGTGLWAWLVIGAGTVGYVACVISFVALIFVVMFHNSLLQQGLELRTRADIQMQNASRIERDWDELPNWRLKAPDEFRAVATDLDLVGPSSLFRLICVANTPSGVRTLRDWIMTPAAPDEICTRQAAVDALREKPELCNELTVAGSLLSQGLSNPDRFLEWLEGEGWYRHRNWLLWLARASALASIANLVAVFGFGVSQTTGGLLGMAIIGFNVMLSVAYTGSIHDVFFQVTTPFGEMKRYRQLFGLMKQLPESEGRLSELREIVVDLDHGAERQLNSLQRIMDLANLRRAGLFGAIYVVLQLMFLWDFHIMCLLDRWRAAFCTDARRWFDALGELEALVSLANLAEIHPEWTVPKVDLSHGALQAKTLGHPLLSPEACVKNDVEVGPQGSVLLVTGSNMSGKSTLLRSLGLNSVLAHMGATVCASSYESPPLVVATSMRIVDSLDDGVSFFMAELKRLKEIVDQADAFTDPNGPMLLYLLDEILQGTNSAERRIAVARVVAHLLARRAIGAISTHDLELASDPTLAAACQPVHFRESFREVDGARKMTFDYEMHSGVAQTTNALVLLEMVGLNEREEKSQ